MISLKFDRFYDFFYKVYRIVVVTRRSQKIVSFSLGRNMREFTEISYNKGDTVIFDVSNACIDFTRVEAPPAANVAGLYTSNR